MKKTLLAIALAVAAMPLMFAAQGTQATAPAGTSSVAGKPATTHARKHRARKHVKKSVKTAPASAAPAQK
jgi:hypothetical protein